MMAMMRRARPLLEAWLRDSGALLADDVDATFDDDVESGDGDSDGGLTPLVGGQACDNGEQELPACQP